MEDRDRINRTRRPAGNRPKKRPPSSARAQDRPAEECSQGEDDKEICI